MPRQPFKTDSHQPSDSEIAAFDKWRKRHNGRGHNAFMVHAHTGIGTVQVAFCSGCGKAKDVSEYEHW